MWKLFKLTALLVFFKTLKILQENRRSFIKWSIDEIKEKIKHIENEIKLIKEKK